MIGPASDIPLLDRFIKISDVSYKKYFKAVAIIDRTLLNEELMRDIQLPAQDDEFEVVVLGVQNLKALYETVFTRALAEAKV